MPEFALSLSKGVQLPALLEYDDEFYAIREETALGTLLRESALFRMWRIKATRLYEVPDEDGEQYAPRFSTWGEFVKSIAEYAGVSRSTIFSRVRLYDQLTWLGYDLETAYSIVVKKSYLAGKVLDMIIEWDNKNHDESQFKTDYFGDGVVPVDAKEDVMELLEECLAHDSVSGAIDNVKSEILGKPIVDMYYMDGSVVVAYDGELGMDVIRFVPEGNREVVPDWVLNELESKYKLRRSE